MQKKKLEQVLQNNPSNPVVKRKNHDVKTKNMGMKIKEAFMEQIKANAKNDNKDDIDMSDFEIPLFHEHIVENFISKFTLKIRNIVSNKVVQSRQMMSVKNEWSMND